MTESTPEMELRLDIARSEVARVHEFEFRVVNPGTAEAGSNYGHDLRSDTRYGNGAWSGNYRGGRVHEPAGH